VQRRKPPPRLLQAAPIPQFNAGIAETNISPRALVWRSSAMELPVSVSVRHACTMLFQLVLVAGAPAPVRAQMQPLDWRTFEVPQYGTRVEYPAGLFVPAGAPAKGVGERFETRDGRAVLSIYSRMNEAADTPASYLQKNLRVRSGLDYQRITPSFFAISAERDGLIYYSRCNFSPLAGSTTHCFDLVYPQEEKRAWDPVVTRISLSLQPKR
jgi:hypothetical protein